jgi:hypothetical protein
MTLGKKKKIKEKISSTFELSKGRSLIIFYSFKI